MDLVISKKHTRYARRSDGSRCPTARAMREAGFKNFSVSHAGVDVDGKFVAFPVTLANNITKYDNGEEFKTGKFRIPGLKRPVKV